MSNRDIIVAGDVHGCFGRFNQFINKKHPKIVLQCGDWGFWPRADQRAAWEIGHPEPSPKVGETKVYWCDGNHEDHQCLLRRSTNELWKNVFYMKRGSTLGLPDGRVVMFFGGADSYDKNQRKPGWNWFSEEMITEQDMEDLPDVKVDIVISHTCPMEFDVYAPIPDKMNDECRSYLSRLLERYKPSRWYFGHWHKYKAGEYGGCKWTGLSMLGRTDWWKYLE